MPTQSPWKPSTSTQVLHEVTLDESAFPTLRQALRRDEPQDAGRKLADMLHQRAQRARVAEVAAIVREWLETPDPGSPGQNKES